MTVETRRSAAGECPHPSVFIQQEMDSRGWDRWTLARHMGGDYQLNRLEIDLYFEVGPATTDMRLGRTGDGLARAFGVSAEFFCNLEGAWLESVKRRGSVAGEAQ